jgi:hypothetical protein
MDIKAELYNLKKFVLKENDISYEAKKKIANRIFDIQKKALSNDLKQTSS